jgi:hypothetical protein
MRFWAVSITAASEYKFLVHTGSGIDMTKLSGSATTKLAADPASKQPADWDPIVNGLWQPPAAAPAATARPVSPPPSSSPPPQSWDESPGGVAWNMWRNSGGYGGGVEPAQGWIDKLNGR